MSVSRCVLFVLVLLLASCGVTTESRRVDDIRLSELGPDESLVISYNDTCHYGCTSGVMRIDGNVAWTLGRQVTLTDADLESLEASISQGDRPDPDTYYDCNLRAHYATVRVRKGRIFEDTPLRISCKPPPDSAGMTLHDLASMLLADNPEVSQWTYARVPIDAETIDLLGLDERK